MAEGRSWRSMTRLRSSKVHRNLDAKMKIGGFEVFDLLFVLLMASVLNLFFGRTKLAFYLVLLLPSLLAGVLFVVKRNKPEQYLIHLLRFLVSPGFLSASEPHPKIEQIRNHIQSN